MKNTSDKKILLFIIDVIISSILAILITLAFINPTALPLSTQKLLHKIQINTENLCSSYITNNSSSCTNNCSIE